MPMDAFSRRWPWADGRRWTAGGADAGGTLQVLPLVWLLRLLSRGRQSESPAAARAEIWVTPTVPLQACLALPRDTHKPLVGHSIRGLRQQSWQQTYHKSGRPSFLDGF